MPGADMGIDLGTSNTLIYLSGKGIILNEPSVVAVDTWSGEIIAMGAQAQKMIGRTSDRIEVARPLSGGVISQYDYAEKMLVSFMKRVSNNAVFNPRVVVCIPGEITEVERRALVDAAHRAGARKICLLEEAVAAAIGAGIDISGPHGCAVIDIGGGTTDMAVITLGGVAAARSIKLAGAAFDEEIIKYVRRKHNLIIGARMAEQAKIEIGCVRMPEQLKTFCVKGRNALSGLPQAAEITSQDMLSAMEPTALMLAKQAQELLEETAPELVGDLYTDGIVLTGGGALIDGMDRLLEENTRLHVCVADDPLECVARGAGAALAYLDKLDAASGISSLNPLIEG